MEYEQKRGFSSSGKSRQAKPKTSFSSSEAGEQKTQRRDVWELGGVQKKSENMCWDLEVVMDLDVSRLVL